MPAPLECELRLADCGGPTVWDRHDEHGHMVRSGVHLLRPPGPGTTLVRKLFLARQGRDDTATRGPTRAVDFTADIASAVATRTLIGQGIVGPCYSIPPRGFQ